MFRQTVLIVFTTIGIAVQWFTTRDAVADLDPYARALQSEASPAPTQAEEVADMQQLLDVLRHQVQMQHELNPGLGYTQVLATLAQLMPASLALTELHATGRAPVVRERGSGLHPSEHDSKSEVAFVQNRSASNFG